MFTNHGAAHHYRVYITLRKDKSASTQLEFLRAFTSTLTGWSARIIQLLSRSAVEGTVGNSSLTKTQEREKCFHKTSHFGGGGGHAGRAQGEMKKGYGGDWEYREGRHMPMSLRPEEQADKLHTAFITHIPVNQQMESLIAKFSCISCSC